ncbi:MAG: septum site-determining protein MinC [Synechococcaceae cyanobacterium RL_1_2]|nr:septum site-determining protein MinC [Synechococcaceae cyanobacterium RL_1_2]
MEPLSLGQVNLKAHQDKMLMIFPAISGVGDWTDLWEDIVHRFRGLDYRWPPGTPVHLHCREHLLGIRELQAISELLNEVELSLVKVFTTRRQTAVAAVTAGYSVEQEIPGTDPTVLLGGESSPKEATIVKEPLYYANTVRSGVNLNHPGSVIVVGDVNPGGSITAGGDILVWGMLRGIAHAGVDGDRRRKIMALQLKAPQVRIADAVALVPQQKLPTQDYPEIAYITPEGIRITQASKFSKQFEFSDRANGWIDSSIDNFNEA